MTVLKVQELVDTSWNEIGDYCALVRTADGEWINYSFHPGTGWVRSAYADKAAAHVGPEEVPPEVMASYSTLVN